MRTPSKPLFKTYEIVAIVAFVIAAIGVGSLRPGLLAAFGAIPHGFERN